MGEENNVEPATPNANAPPPRNRTAASAYILGRAALKSHQSFDLVWTLSSPLLTIFVKLFEPGPQFDWSSEDSLTIKNREEIQNALLSDRFFFLRRNKYEIAKVRYFPGEKL